MLVLRLYDSGPRNPDQVHSLEQLSQAIPLMSDFEGLLEEIASGVVPVVRGIESEIPELVYHYLPECRWKTIHKLRPMRTFA